MCETFSQHIYMAGILHNRIIKTVLFFPVSKYLSSIFLIFIAKNPAAIIFNFKYDNARFRCHCHIYLHIFSIGLLNV